MRSIKRLATAALCVALGSAAAAQQIQFIGLPGYEQPQARGVSADGSTIFGARTDYMGFRWRSSTGLQELGLLPGTIDSFAQGANSDGSTVVGGAFILTTRAFRWTQASGIQTFPGPLGQLTSFAYDISADSSTVVGWYFPNASESRAFRWTEAGGLEPLPLLTTSHTGSARAVNADGSTIVGDDSQQAVRWTSAGIEPLGVLPGRAHSLASDVSADGQVIIGTSSNGTQDKLAFRWMQAGGMESLGLLPGADNAEALAISGDGNTIVGHSWAAGDYRAFIWTSAAGILDLNDYAALLGVNLNGAVLLNARGISHDGTVIVGVAEVPGYPQPITYRLVIPCPAGAPLLAAGGLMAVRRRRPG